MEEGKAVAELKEDADEVIRGNGTEVRSVPKVKVIIRWDIDSPIQTMMNRATTGANHVMNVKIST